MYLCLFTGVCIGHYNERFFVVLTFYISLSMACESYFARILLCKDPCPDFLTSDAKLIIFLGIFSPSPFVHLSTHQPFHKYFNAENISKQQVITIDGLFIYSLAFLLTVLGYLLYYYLRDTFYDSSTAWDYFLPITVYKWLMGYYGHQYILCVSIVRFWH